MNVRRELDSFAVGETQHLVVVQYGVHVLNPQRVHWTVTDYPLMRLGRLLNTESMMADIV